MSVGIIQEKIISAITEALKEVRLKGFLHSDSFPVPSVEFPKREEWGDFSSNVAMSISKFEGRAPQEIAELIAKELKNSCNFFEKIDIAAPGFLNFRLRRDFWFSVLQEIDEKGHSYGHSAVGEGQRVLLEFVSANPTGPLHVGHGRGAAFGEALSRILQASGFSVEREYYINDAGRQMKLLASSVYSRYLELQGRSSHFPEDGYHGEYIQDLAKQISKEIGSTFLDLDASEAQERCGSIAYQKLLEAIKRDLVHFGIEFESWYSEASLFSSGKIQEALDELKNRDLVFKKDGALWFCSSKFKDEKDRVVCKQDGDYTYLASDIAYHFDKLRRGFDLLINIWGADHHGYVPRMQGTVEALGYSKEQLSIVLVQMVSLFRHGQKMEMSKRTGEFVTLRDVVDEVGADAAKFFFLMRRADTHLEFDLGLAKKQSSENPVYYVQYAHARLSSLFRMACERGFKIPPIQSVTLSVLTNLEEFRLIKHLSGYPGLVKGCAEALEPHRLTFYLQELASLLHAFYYKHRVLPSGDGESCGQNDEKLTNSTDVDSIEEVVASDLIHARLFLLCQVQTVIKNGLNLLGVSTPDKM